MPSVTTNSTAIGDRPPAITVVIPAYRAAETIERAVRSVLAQPRVDAAVVVVVDDQCEQTQATVRAVGDERIRLIVNEGNRGAQFSRNAGLAATSTPLVMFLDADDYLTGDLLARLIAAMTAAAADVGFGPWVWLDETSNVYRREVSSFGSSRSVFADWLTRRRWVPPCSVVWRTDFVRQIGGWDEAIRRNQDGELVLRAILKGARIAQSREGAGIYVQHHGPHRITRSADNYGSLLEVADKLLQMPSDVLDEGERRDVLARYHAVIAMHAYRRGDDAFGGEALRLSRALGFRGAVGSMSERVGVKTLGAETYFGLRRTLRSLLRATRRGFG